MCAPLCATGGRPAATLAISVAVSRASQTPPINSSPQTRNAKRETRNRRADPRATVPRSAFPLPRFSRSAFRVHTPSARGSPNLLELPGVQFVTVPQLKVPIERWHPGPRAFGPFDQDDGPVAHHVVESQVLRLGRGPEAVAVDVIHHAVLGRAVLVDQRVRRPGGESSSPQPPADRLDERGLTGAELTGQPDDDRRRELAAERLTEPVEGVRRERSEEHTSELQSRENLVCRLLLEKKKKKKKNNTRNKN